MTYDEWIGEVDRILNSKIGLSHRDLSDRLWRDSYEDGESPEDAVFELVGDLDEGLEDTLMDEMFG